VLVSICMLGYILLLLLSSVEAGGNDGSDGRCGSSQSTIHSLD